jgi:hypothetical protein
MLRPYTHFNFTRLCGSVKHVLGLGISIAKAYPMTIVRLDGILWTVNKHWVRSPEWSAVLELSGRGECSGCAAMDRASVKHHSFREDQESRRSLACVQGDSFAVRLGAGCSLPLRFARLRIKLEVDTIRCAQDDAAQRGSAFASKRVASCYHARTIVVPG